MIKQNQIAKLSGVSNSYLSDIFSGKAEIGKKTAKKLAEVSGIPWHEIISMEPQVLKRALSETIAQVPQQ